MSEKVYSMTGFGRAEVHDEKKKLAVEIKSVNHRYLEFTIRSPKKFSVLESNIRNTLKNYAQRGKLDVYITYEDYSDSEANVHFNAQLAREYMAYADRIEKEFGISNDLTASKLLSFPDVVETTEEQTDEDALWKELEPVLTEAAENFMQSRNTEGENLRRDLLLKLDHMEKNVDQIIRREPEIMEDYRSRLEEKTKELLGDAQVDESRIAAEVVIFADKICTDEETVRLKSHIQSMKDTLAKGFNIGRKLDFLAQEMNREANTILSKANDLEISGLGVDLKTEIEKIREQVQNVE
ncbi:MAG: YicC/YloC family endoribonuclease [Eubacteriales bacterium]|jgi:uncharacterized protein (TIGR00255 family)